MMKNMKIQIIIILFLGTVFKIEGRHAEPTGHSERIFRGVPAKQGEFPSQLAMNYKGSFICGASVLNANWALTAADCINENEPELMTLQAGSIYLENGGTMHQAIELITHKDYVYETLKNDIAVIKVEPPFNIDGVNVSSVKLPEDGENPKEPSTAFITGWGLDENGESPTVLNKLTTWIIDQHICNTSYNSYGSAIYDGHICTQGITSSGPCTYDNGGPVFVNGTIVGIVTRGYGCGSSFFPDRNTRVSYYIKWIRQNTGL